VHFQIYEYYLKLGHLQRNRRKVYELCFVYGSEDHLKSDYPIKKAQNTAPICNTSNATIGENPRPTDRETLLHPQQQAYSQAQKRPKVRTDGKKRQTDNLTNEEVKILDGVKTGRDT